MIRTKGTIGTATQIEIVWNWIDEPKKYLIWNTDFSQHEIGEAKEKKGEA
jgi:hypothetical protein